MGVQVNVRMEGLRQVLGDLRKIETALKQAVYSGVDEATTYLASEVRKFIENEGDGTWEKHREATVDIHGAHKVGVLSGKMLSSVKVVPHGGGLEGAVQITAPYAGYFEMGGWKPRGRVTSDRPVAARHIMSPVVERERQTIYNIIAKSVVNLQYPYGAKGGILQQVAGGTLARTGGSGVSHEVIATVKSMVNARGRASGPVQFKHIGGTPGFQRSRVWSYSRYY